MKEALDDKQIEHIVGRHGLRIPVIDNPETANDVGSFFHRFRTLNGIESEEFFIPNEAGKPLVVLRGCTLLTEPEEPGDLTEVVKFHAGYIAGPFNESKTTYTIGSTITHRGESNDNIYPGDDMHKYEDRSYGDEDFPSFKDIDNIKALYSRAVVRAALKECVELLS